MTEKVRVGILGCGNISKTYIDNINEKFSEYLEVVACADINQEAADKAAMKCGCAFVCTYAEMLENEKVEVVLNLTNSWAHYETSLQALNAGKSVYSEKTLTLDREQANNLVETASVKNLKLGCAPDTFMGAGMQTIRAMMDAGTLGKISYVDTFIGMNVNNPNYALKKHGGILFDMAPYYIASLVNLLGPIRRVSGFAEKIAEKKTANGCEYELEIPSTTTSIVQFENGVIGNFTACNDTISYIPKFEIYGTGGNAFANDPNHFSGELSVQLLGKDIEKIGYTHKYTDNYRGIGLVDMACAMRFGGDFRANGELARHIVDVLQSLWESKETGKTVEIKYTCIQPEAVSINGDKRWEF